jgi:hypothetical protein
MASITLACGPYFDETGLWLTLLLLIVIKPLAYFAFIQAFRYRVSRPYPMLFSQAAKLTAMRSGLGLVLTAIGGVLFVGIAQTSETPALLALSWLFLYAERVFSWWLVGSWGAGLRGRRLAGWIISGTLMNAAFDGAIVLGLMHGALPIVAITAGIGMCIWLLHVVGRRASLKMRFTRRPVCLCCGYDLTGNISGRCPECGRAVDGPIGDEHAGAAAVA